MPEKDQQRCRRVRDKGLGKCGKCRWWHGCLRCDFPKAVRYYLEKLTENEVSAEQAQVRESRLKARLQAKKQARGLAPSHGPGTTPLP